MKQWVWLAGTISSISFAQIANSSPYPSHQNYTLLTQPFYSGIFFPFEGKLQQFGIYSENTVNGTDLVSTNCWASFNESRSQHRILGQIAGSPDWYNVSVSTSHFIQINKNIALGTHLGFLQDPLKNRSLNAGLHANIIKKDIRMVGSYTRVVNQTEFALGASYQYYNSILGLFLIKEGQPYYAYAYTQVPVHTNTHLLLKLGSGPNRFGASLLHRVNNISIQVGTEWWWSLNRFKTFIQVHYERQNSGVAYRGVLGTVDKRTN